MIPVINLTSGFSGWAENVRTLLFDLEDPEAWKRAVPSVCARSLTERYRELRCICLVDELTLSESRRVFPPVPRSLPRDSDRYFFDRNLDRGDREVGDRPIEDLLDEMEAAPWRYPNEPGSEDDLSAGENDGDNRQAMERYIAHHWPHLGGFPRAPSAAAPWPGSANDVEIVVDCYGMYVRSLRTWLREVGGRGSSYSLPRKADEIEELQDGGPAVLLCPEAIETVDRLVAQTSPSSIRELLQIDRNPDLLFLKTVLLHEIGHHIFDVVRHESHTETRIPVNLSEGLANWFASAFLDAEERLLLLAKTWEQTRPYRMHLGLAWLQHGTSWPWFPGLSPDGSGRRLVAWIERLAFEGRLPLRRSVSLPSSASQSSATPDEEWIARSVGWLEALLEDGVREALHSARPISQSGPDRAEMMALVMIAEAIPELGPGVSKVIREWRRSEKDWRPPSNSRQHQSLQEIARLPRVGVGEKKKYLNRLQREAIKTLERWRLLASLVSAALPAKTRMPLL